MQEGNKTAKYMNTVGRLDVAVVSSWVGCYTELTDGLCDSTKVMSHSQRKSTPLLKLLSLSGNGEYWRRRMQEEV